MTRIRADGPLISVDEAARQLGVSVEQMLAWNMVVIVDDAGRRAVPHWAVDPLVARFMPTMSQVFQGEALAYCLTRMRPFQDMRDGVSALQAGQWGVVLDALRDLRARLDSAMQAEDAALAGLLAGVMAVQAPVTLH